MIETIWALNNGTYTIRFARSPFLQHAGAEEIPVSPLSEPRTVAAPNGKYKYSVHDTNGKETDDPDVIIV